METIHVTRSSMPSYEEYIEAIKPLWDSHWLTNMGKYHKELEKQLREYLDVPYVSLMVNGHLSLELTLQSFGFPEGSEVITTPYTFISTTHAIVRNRLVPVFCDIKPEDGTIDESKIEDLITEKTVAIMPVHVYGNICNDEAIAKIAYKYNLKVIYDACHAFGERIISEDTKGNKTYRGVGNLGHASVFSFHATKVFNTVEGGASVFKDPELYEKLYNLKNFGIRGEELVVAVGANAKMNELCAIMGLCNLKHIENAIAARKKCNDKYTSALVSVPRIKLLTPREDVTRNYAYYPIIVADGYKCTRDELYLKLREHNIFPRKYFYPITSDQACFKNKYKNCKLDAARDMADHILMLPIFEDLSPEDQDRILDIVLNPNKMH
ncbi:DegT/DnrJ/EryC1/StrS family aminotransferase [Butyrivibrio sp. WCE2006]|uniref:DegT/DnrJ/EryC1/StrS family aminotransferase n=1 Tax=Butyrivibrio sp. WCE2006 TaxID=1410611 RepID=UPI0005D1378B|nr:DegT/DnrJ/EryC1/StrS family aminotransferase [Butyrivibrio sp. WCE2006]